MFRINKFRKPFGYTCNFEKLKPVIFRKFVSKSNNSYSSSIGKYLAVFGIGVGTFYLINKYKNVSNNQKDKKDDEPMLSLDLNEIYEKTAVIFLSNPEVNLKIIFYFTKILFLSLKNNNVKSYSATVLIKIF